MTSEDTARRVLVVDDEPSVRLSIGGYLEDGGHIVRLASSCREGLREFRRRVDAVVLDHRLPDGSGLDLLRDLRAEAPRVPVIMLTAYSDVAQAVEAMKAGAFHYLGKPCALDALGSVVQAALRTAPSRHAGEGDAPPLIGESAPMRRVRRWVRRVAASPSGTVLLTGESGTGKDVVARLLHAWSARAPSPFTNVTCSAIPETLLESELFGHERGAFTDARASKPGLVELSEGGTLFLDEVAEMSPALQAKLLRFLEDKSFRRVGGTEDKRADVRVVAATHRDLREEVAAGRFREDLFYRLAVLEVPLPPLRERQGDVRLLTRFFVERFGRELSGGAVEIGESAWQVLEDHDWPGNVRELRNALERAVLMREGASLTARDLDVRSARPATPGAFRLPPEGVRICEVERQLLEQALERAGGNRTRAGALVGLNRDQVRYRITKLGLEGRSGEQP